MSGALAFTAGAACVLTAVAVVPLRRLALRWDLVDRPDGSSGNGKNGGSGGDGGNGGSGGYKTHARPTPYLGGIAILVGTVAPTMVVLGFGDLQLTAILMAATAVSVLGLIDDIGALPAATRLAVETVAATGVVVSGVRVTVTGAWPDDLLTVAWIVVMTNSFNLLDNMDGALGTVTAVTAGLLAATALLQGYAALGVPLCALACAGLGFLPHNWAPAKVFMGDSGSLFVGFTLACSAVLLVMGQPLAATAAGLFLPTFVATVDTCVVLVSRTLAGRPPLRGGTDHLSHRLRRTGLGTRATAATLGAVTAVTGALHLATVLGEVPPLAAVAVAIVIAAALACLLRGAHVPAAAQPAGISRKVHERRL